MLRKIISGGQTGADQGGLEAAKELGLETGGVAPPKFWTEGGPFNLFLRDLYGLEEGDYDPHIYPKRTRRNVLRGDATVLFGNVSSAGTKLTIRYCRSLGRPYLINPTVKELRMMIEEQRIEVLNVAGNRESRNPGLQERVRAFLVQALKEVI